MQLDCEQFFYIVTCSYNLAFQTSFLVRGHNLGIESFGLGLDLATPESWSWSWS